MSQEKMKEEDISYANVKINDHVLLDIVQVEEDLVKSIREKMISISSCHRINRVPQELKKGSEHSYTPKLVSIGPFHHGVDNLNAMEEHKWCYLNTLISRKPINTQTILENCVKTLRNLEDKARKCYGENTIEQIGSNEFVQMMLLDTGFLIELFIKFAIKGPQIHSKGTQMQLHNVLHLHDVGIKFKKAISESVMNIRFNKDRVLEIPSLKIQSYSEVLLTNMVALEQCGGGTKHVASYVYLMKSLVRSADDASFLTQREILDSSLYSDEEIFQLMLRLHVEFDVKDFYYSGLCEKVNGYKKKNKWKECWNRISNVYKKIAKTISG
ncbi:hypothetical protein HAX54_052342 [Datura stramonium]|uniref:Uncharacterized protein n=1 Tax=Datura stramonium TaxID=4076 RepID=A0ABS8SZL8_DATST|nr:hypothetical protein [Datura stramonium]